MIHFEFEERRKMSSCRMDCNCTVCAGDDELYACCCYEVSRMDESAGQEKFQEIR